MLCSGTRIACVINIYIGTLNCASKCASKIGSEGGFRAGQYYNFGLLIPSRFLCVFLTLFVSLVPLGLS